MLTEGTNLIMPHLAPIVRGKERKSVKWQAGKLAIKGFLQLLWPLNYVGEMLEFIENIREAKTIRDQDLQFANTDRLTIGIQHEKLVKDAVDTFTELFEGILDNRNKDAPNIPVILAIDDAQWVDATTLNFLQNLLLKSVANKWPLMVIATHWEREWNNDRQNLNSDDNDGLTLAKVVETVGRQSKDNHWSGHEIQVDRLDDDSQSQTLKEALPGINEVQSEVIIQRVDGNPLFLAQIIGITLQNDFHFVGSDRNNKLTDRFMDRIESEFTDLHKTVEARFAALEGKIKLALMGASIQGKQFFDEIVALVYNDLSPGANGDSLVKTSLETANHPLAI